MIRDDLFLFLQLIHAGYANAHVLRLHVHVLIPCSNVHNNIQRMMQIRAVGR